MRKLIIGLLLVSALAVAGIASAHPAVTTLTGTVGPEDTITLTSAGHKVTALKAGAYTIVIHDLANDHNFHLVGPGVAKTTSVGGTGTVVWHVKLKHGTYNYVCDPHANFMHGRVSVR